MKTAYEEEQEQEQEEGHSLRSFARIARCR